MCKLCGKPEGVHPKLDKMFEDIPEYLLETMNRIGQHDPTQGDPVPGQVSAYAIVGAYLLAGFFMKPDMPVPAVESLEEGGLGLEWRSGNRTLEVEVFPDGERFEFLTAQVDVEEEDIEGQETAPTLTYLYGDFTSDQLMGSIGGGGPSLLADWLTGGEFVEELHKYVNQEAYEDTCSVSEPGSEDMKEA